MLPQEMIDECKSDTSSVISLSDYSPSTWSHIISYGVPTVGIALLAVSHPVFVLVSAGLFLGVGRAYPDLKSDHCSSLCGRASAASVVEDELKSESHRAFTVSSTATVSTESSNEEIRHDQVSSCDAALQDESTEDLPSPLAHLVVKETFNDLHAKDFFQIFFGDDAPFSFRDFQEKSGDLDIVYSRWGENNKRVLKFKSPTKTPFFGPSHARATKTQNLRVHNKACVVIEATTTLEDIPFSDHFVVCEQWVIKSTQEKECMVTVTAQPRFLKSCPFASQIESKSTATLRQVLTAWCDMAQKALVLSEKKRRQDPAPKCPSEEIELVFNHRSKQCCFVGEDVEELDWEMDPISPTYCAKNRKKTIRLSIAKRLSKKYRLKG
jgi:VAD1 Analog of StAR-related lipid transfer domain